MGRTDGGHGTQYGPPAAMLLSENVTYSAMEFYHLANNPISLGENPARDGTGDETAHLRAL